MALPADAVPVHRFVEILERHGVSVTELSNGLYRFRRDLDDDHFLEVWPLSGTFVWPAAVQRFAERLGIHAEEFADPQRPDRIRLVGL